MNTYYDKLRSAPIDEKLINIYQQDSEIVYTGIVQYLSDKDFILMTFNDYGIQDGEVYLKIDSVQKVETDSYDLANMKDRIAFDEKNDLANKTEFNMPFNISDSIFDKLVAHVKQNKQMVLIVTEKAKKMQYHEGIITDFDHDEVTFSIVDKFNFTHKNQTKIKNDDISAIEFGGTELNLLEQILPTIIADNHVDDEYLTRDHKDKFAAVIKHAELKNQMIIIDTNDDRKYFYVGKAIASNDNELVMMVIDMNGHFGGYVWMRYDNVYRIVTESDYLFVMRRFVNYNKATKEFTLPVLNADRAFDDNDNILMEILLPSIKFKKLLRLQLTSGKSIMGYPLGFETRTGILTFEMIDLDDENDDIVRKIGIESIREMAFDYFKSFLLENNID